MTTFFGIIGMLGSAVCAAWLIIQWIRKQPKKLPLICLAASLVLMVLIPFSRTASWWIAAICTVLMFLLAAWTFYAAFRKDGLVSKIQAWPIFNVG